jgi:ABC-type arginine transport system permease subunit
MRPTVPRPTAPASTALPKGQWEASIALNLDPVTKWTKIILPQAIPNVLPALGNYLVAAFKDAPMGFILNVYGVLAVANTIRGEDFRAQEPYILAGVAFLAVSIPAAWAVRRLERRISYERTETTLTDVSPKGAAGVRMRGSTRRSGPTWCCATSTWTLNRANVS